MRRIDIGLGLGFLGCVAYYALATGWQGALVGGLLYIMMVMLAVWIF